MTPNRSAAPADRKRTVLVAVGDPITRIGLETLLHDADDCLVVGAVESAADVLDDVEQYAPDVVLLDIGFRRREPSLIADLARTYPESRVLVLVDHADEECALRYLVSRGDAERATLSDEAVQLLDDCCMASLRERAWGCLPRGSGPERVLGAVRSVAAGEIAAAPWLGVMSKRSPAPSPAGERRHRPITARELEVIALVAEGLGNKEMAGRLGIQEQTVKNHLGHIMAKLNLESRLEIGLFAAKHHLTVRQRTMPPAQA